MDAANLNHLRAELADFLPKDFKLLINWIDSSELNYLWGGPKFEFPLTIEQLQQHYTQVQAKPFLLIVRNEAVGFCELYKVSKTEYRVCRVFVSPAHRGKGYGAKILDLVISKAKNKYSSQRLLLNVFAHNKPAIACYEKLGFRTYDIVSDIRSFNGNNWDLVRMSINLS
ncbi:GNAT family N-acetyltransferase [Vibrio marisflavi]|uniref:Acetyltransferase n=1 Tax=Vibrio marisflavi CECT 7928 TaxID=634439 RepID=A0ABM9A4V3_9VIBR|nr:GNAT family protein [Vibrio marisflavi]CAH0539702.1 Acetyltransferase [Vibrio marisflavi CECT 7928]